jgi:hypothetical protein
MLFVPIVDMVGRELRRALGIDVDRLDAWMLTASETCVPAASVTLEVVARVPEQAPRAHA